MALHINHCYYTRTFVNYYSNNRLVMWEDEVCGTIDEISEHICDVIVKYDFDCGVATEATSDIIIVQVDRI